MNNPLKILIRVDPKDIAFLTKIFEGYDGLAVVSTLDREKGVFGSKGLRGQRLSLADDPRWVVQIVQRGDVDQIYC